MNRLKTRATSGTRTDRADIRSQTGQRLHLLTGQDRTDLAAGWSCRWGGSVERQPVHSLGREARHTGDTIRCYDHAVDSSTMTAADIRRLNLDRGGNRAPDPHYFKPANDFTARATHFSKKDSRRQ